MPDRAGFRAAMMAASPDGIAVAFEDPGAGPYGLWPGEVLDRAVPARLAEFAAGRRAARAAMAALGLAPAAILHGPDRAPVWPAGVVGSISHAEGLCLALVGRSDAWAAIGVDLEVDRPVDRALWPAILGPDERARIEALPDDLQGPFATAVFVAKEAAYKAQYPHSRTLFDFQTLAVEMTGDRFVAKFTKGVAGYRVGHELPGTFCRADGYIAAFCAIRQVRGV